MKFCMYGNKQDENGCDTCDCNTKRKFVFNGDNLTATNKAQLMQSTMKSIM